jgi:hypothetical protein
MGYFILIHSCRTGSWLTDVFGDDTSIQPMQRKTVQEMKAWLDQHEIPYDAIDDGSKGKPPAAFYIDDKAISFGDNWSDIAEYIARLTAATRARYQSRRGGSRAYCSGLTCPLISSASKEMPSVVSIGDDFVAMSRLSERHPINASPCGVAISILY